MNIIINASRSCQVETIYSDGSWNIRHYEKNQLRHIEGIDVDGDWYKWSYKDGVLDGKYEYINADGSWGTCFFRRGVRRGKSAYRNPNGPSFPYIDAGWHMRRMCTDDGPILSALGN